MILLEIWKGVLAVGLYLGAFVFAGALLPEKYHKSSLTNLCLLGFVVYFGVFQIVALPMKIGRLSSEISYSDLGGDSWGCISF